LVNAEIAEHCDEKDLDGQATPEVSADAASYGLLLNQL
jgi:hypothetical protein